MAKKKSQKSLKRWGDQDWGYVSEGDEKKPKKKEKEEPRPKATDKDYDYSNLGRLKPMKGGNPWS